MTYEAEKIVPYNDENAPKSKQIERMFDEIAPQYDLLNLPARADLYPCAA